MYSRTPVLGHVLVTSDTKSAKDDQPGLECYIALIVFCVGRSKAPTMLYISYSIVLHTALMDFLYYIYINLI